MLKPYKTAKREDYYEKNSSDVNRSGLCSRSAIVSAPTLPSETIPDTISASSEAAKAASEETTGSNGGSRLNDILARGYIEVAMEPYFAPNEFIDPSRQGEEQYVGADVELARYIADKLGVECRIVPLEFSAVLTGVTEGKYDLAISALAYTPARAEAMEMSKGYRFDEDNANNFGLMIRSGDLDTIKSADDLTDKIVVCQSGSLQELFATEQIPACRELKRVSATTAESSMVIVPDFSFVVDESTSGTRIGIPKGETALLNKINEIIDEVTASGIYDEWYEKYTEYAKTLGL